MPVTSGAAAISFVQLNGSRLHRGFPQVEGLEKRRRKAREATMHPRSWHSRLRLFPPLLLLRLQPPFLTVVRARALARVLGRRARAAGAGGAARRSRARRRRFVLRTGTPTPPADGPEVGPSWRAARVPLMSFVLPPRDEPGAALAAPLSPGLQQSVVSRPHRLLSCFGLIRELL